MSRRDRMRARTLPRVTVRIPVDAGAYAAAEQALAAARRTGGDVAAAQAHLDGVERETYVVTALPPTRWEALVAGHPPTDEQRGLGWEWDPAGFRPALLAACVTFPDDAEEPFTEAEWAEFATAGHLAAGELAVLFTQAVNLNARAPAVEVGKG